jgi:hypothetical protein
MVPIAQAVASQLILHSPPRREFFCSKQQSALQFFCIQPLDPYLKVSHIFAVRRCWADKKPCLIKELGGMFRATVKSHSAQQQIGVALRCRNLDTLSK